jgi:1,5-anhydro-D-fructose reductase (1,5-anhydro-D-mannitol-forming)
VRFGIAGCGWVARDYVAPALAEAEGATAVASFDPDPAARIDGLRAHGSLEALAADPEVDAVYVAAPNDRHLAITEVAAAAGKHVLCEKPMAASLEQARAIAAACERGGVRYATAFDQRYHPAHVALRERLGALGTVTAARVVYACWLGPDWSGDNWRAEPERAGGGALMDLAPHGLDLLRSLLGAELEEVVALKQRRVHPYAVDDGAMLAARYEGDVLASLHVAYNHPEDLPRRRLELVGTEGMAVATDTMGQDPGGALEVCGEAVAFAGTSPFTGLVEAFAAGTVTGDDLRLMELLEPWR